MEFGFYGLFKYALGERHSNHHATLQRRSATKARLGGMTRRKEEGDANRRRSADIASAELKSTTSAGRTQVHPAAHINTFTITCTWLLLNSVYTIQPVVKPVEQPVECLLTRCSWLFNGFDNQLYRVNGVLVTQLATHKDGI